VATVGIVEVTGARTAVITWLKLHKKPEEPITR